VDILQTNEAFRDVFQAWSGCAQHNRKRMHAGPGGCLENATLPQLKSRTLMPAAAGTVMLVYNDSSFNVIENLFVPGEDFVYFQDADDFEAKLRRILQNYEQYVPMAQRARQKVLQHYTLERWLETYVAPVIQQLGSAEATGT